MATKIHIDDWFALEMAFGYTGADRDAYLDLRTGGVRVSSPDERVDERAVDEPDHFIRIDPAPSGEQFRWLVKFAASVDDGKLRMHLERALSAPGAFRHFQDVLRPHTEEWHRWRLARMALVREYVLAWLAEKDLDLDEPPPWRRSGVPVPKRQVSEDERLRLVAHQHLDRLSDRGVELAIAYLRHVHRRWGIK